jgi:hypothetical protein
MNEDNSVIVQSFENVTPDVRLMRVGSNSSHERPMKILVGQRRVTIRDSNDRDIVVTTCEGDGSRRGLSLLWL